MIQWWRSFLWDVLAAFARQRGDRCWGLEGAKGTFENREVR